MAIQPGPRDFSTFGAGGGVRPLRAPHEKERPSPVVRVESFDGPRITVRLKASSNESMANATCSCTSMASVPTLKWSRAPLSATAPTSPTRCAAAPCSATPAVRLRSSTLRSSDVPFVEGDVHVMVSLSMYDDCTMWLKLAEVNWHRVSHVWKKLLPCTRIDVSPRTGPVTGQMAETR